MPDDPLTATRAEVTAWFFDDYLPRWVAVASGASAEGPEFILDYWDTPMHVTVLDHAFWCLDNRSVIDFLELDHAPLRELGYTHTAVPGRRVIVYSSVGAAIEVIWSRRRTDESELACLAVHFEVAKSDYGWRAVGVQSTVALSNNLETIWPRGTTVVESHRGRAAHPKIPRSAHPKVTSLQHI